VRDDDFEQRRAQRPGAIDTGTDGARVPGRQTLVDAGPDASLDIPTVPGKRTRVPTSEAHDQGVARVAAAHVAEAQFHVRKAREVMAALRAGPSRLNERVLRADLRCHLADAQRAAAQCLSVDQGRDTAAAVMQLMIDATALGTTTDAQQQEPTVIANRGIQGTGQRLPFHDEIQRAFGPHDLSGVHAHVGGAAADASHALGAHAYAHGEHVAFASEPSLFVAAHEATHVVQQRAGVSLKAIDGGSGDAHEQHADAVAAAVVRGESAAPLLAHLSSNGGGAHAAVQRKGHGEAIAPAAANTPKLNGTELYIASNAKGLWASVANYLQRINFPVPDARLQWRDEPLFTIRLVPALSASVDLQSPSRLLEVLYPAQPYGVIAGLVPLNKKTGAPLDLAWSPAVGHAIAPLFVDAVVASLQRLGPRWVAAAEYSPERAGMLDETRSLVSPDALVASAPIDISVAQALTAGAVVELVGNRPKSDKPRPLRALKHWAWQRAELWNWIKVTDPPDATAEEVAQTLWARAASASSRPPTSYAYGITAAPPLFGIPPTWAIQFDEPKRHAPEKIGESSNEQRLVYIGCC
jgi:hypothetical protein